MTYMTHSKEPSYTDAADFSADLLHDVTSLCSLPADKTRPPKPGAQLQSFRHSLSGELAEEIAHLCTRIERAPLTIYAAAVGLILARLNGQDSTVLGVAAATGSDALAGHLCPLVLKAVPEVTVSELLTDMQAQRTRAVRRANLLPDQIIEAADCILHGADYRPFQVAVMEDLDPVVSSQERDWKTELDLRVRCGARQIEITYAEDLYHVESIALFAERVEWVLQQFCSAPERPSQRVSIMPPTEVAELVALANCPLDPDTSASVSAMVQQFSRRHPNAVAICDDHCQLSYQQLDDLSDRIAALLADRGVTHGRTVGVHLPRNAQVVAWLLGILKLGAVYVPVDVSYPKERVRLLLADAPCAFCLTNTNIHVDLPDGCQRIDVDQSCLDRAPARSMATGKRPVSSDTALLIYTSGSTGRPKGVRISHGNIMNLLEWTKATYRWEDMRCTAATTSLNFDMSVFEIFGTLAVGGTILMLQDALDIIDSPMRHHITMIDTVPSAMRALLPFVSDLTSCRVVILGGEALPRTLCDRLHTGLPGLRLVNVYGPSETGYSTFSEVPVRSHEVPAIGAPIRNTRLLVLSEDGSLTPKGMIGELYIGGSGLSLGYLNRAQLTEEKYISDPGYGIKGRFFRTGDLVSWGHDRELRYHGRLDHQVKIRGHRVELGEIEAVLSAVPGVDNAVTAGLIPPGQTDMTLVAYVTGTAQAEELRRHMATLLPSHMVPQHIIGLDALPLNANGKLDRARLPSPFAAEFQAGEMTQT